MSDERETRIELAASEYVEVRYEEGIRVLEVGCVDGGYCSAVDVPDDGLPAIAAALAPTPPEQTERVCGSCGCPESEHDYKTGKCIACFCEQFAFTPPPEQESSRGIDLIAAERNRQVEREGWSLEHDDEHLLGELTLAAVAYLTRNKSWWPWPDEWKPGPTRKRELVKAGALIAAELDRMDRDPERLPPVQPRPLEPAQSQGDTPGEGGPRGDG